MGHFGPSRCANFPCSTDDRLTSPLFTLLREIQCQSLRGDSKLQVLRSSAERMYLEQTSSVVIVQHAGRSEYNGDYRLSFQNGDGSASCARRYGPTKRCFSNHASFELRLEGEHWKLGPPGAAPVYQAFCEGH